MRVEDRNTGIDLLRILAMYMVVVLHVLGCGGILDSCEKYSNNYYVVWFIEIINYCAVDVFAMITGYVMINAQYNKFKIIPLWITVFFYSVIITLLFKIIPSLNALNVLSTKKIIYSIFFPVLSKQYWYFSSYFGMYFFIPFINKMLMTLDEKEHRNICLTILILYSFLPMFMLTRFDPFSLNIGYSTVWLICLYIIGAYLKRYPIRISKIKCVLLYSLSIIFVWLSKYLSHILIKLIFHKETDIDILVDYTSILILFSAIALLLLFEKIKFNNIKIQKIISFINKLAFSVYIIHSHPLLFDNILYNRFTYIAFEQPYVIIVKVFLISSGIYFACLFIDIIRYYIFCLFKIYNIPAKLSYNKKSITENKERENNEKL